MQRSATYLFALFLLSACGGGGSSSEVLSDPSDRETWNWLLERSDKKEFVHKNDQDVVDWIGFRGGNEYSASIQVNEQGQVVGVTFDNPGFTNAELEKLTGFTHLKSLIAWRNFGPVEEPAGNPYSGEGLAAFAGSNLESVNFGGSRFDDAGLAAATKVGSLKELIIYQTQVTDEGLAALAGNDHIEYLRVEPNFNLIITDKALEPLSKMKAAKHLEINKTLLTWEGLQHLAALEGQLEKLTFKETEIPAEDLDKLKQALPNVAIEHTAPAAENVAQMKEQLGQS